MPPPAMDTHRELGTANAGGSSGLDASAVPPALSSSPFLPAAEEVTVAPMKDLVKERHRKGKMLVMDQSQPSTKQELAGHHHASIQPPFEKLMGSAIRAHGQQSTQPHLDTPPPPFTAVKNVAFEDVAISDRLRAILDDLGAVSPVCVYEKGMWASDRSVEQNRLLISYKGNNSRSRKRKKLSNQDLKAFHFATMFSEKERPLVRPPEDESQDGRNKRRSKQPEEEDEERDHEGRSEQQEDEDDERDDNDGLLEQQEEEDEELGEMEEALLEQQEEAHEERDKKKGKKKKKKEEEEEEGCLSGRAGVRPQRCAVPYEL